MIIEIYNEANIPFGKKKESIEIINDRIQNCKICNGERCITKFINPCMGKAETEIEVQCFGCGNIIDGFVDSKDVKTIINCIKKKENA